MDEPVAPERAWLCARVRAIRMIRGYSQQALAERSDLSIDAIRRLELGYFAPSTTTLTKVARGLGVGRAFLVDNERPPGDEIGLLVAMLRGRAPEVVRLAVRAAKLVCVLRPRERQDANLANTCPARAMVGSSPGE